MGANVSSAKSAMFEVKAIEVELAELIEEIRAKKTEFLVAKKHVPESKLAKEIQKEIIQISKEHSEHLDALEQKKLILARLEAQIVEDSNDWNACLKRDQDLQAEFMKSYRDN